MQYDDSVERHIVSDYFCSGNGAAHNLRQVAEKKLHPLMIVIGESNF
jgi:hypothetical protein